MNKKLLFLIFSGFLYQNSFGQSGFVSGGASEDYNSIGQLAYFQGTNSSFSASDGLQQNFIQVSPLPIQLLSFKVFCRNGQADCIWETATENNNAYFTLERSVDGYHFEFVAQIKGAGNSSHAMTYRYMDSKPFSGINYYRLSQTDLNGYSEVFFPVVADCSFNQEGFEVSVYPNPAHDKVTITTSGFDITHLRLRDMLGKDIKQIDYNGLSSNEFILDISTFSKGIYFIDVYSQDRKVTKKIIKQ